MQNQSRLKKRIDDLQRQLNLLDEKLSGLNEQWILETRFDEKLRLKKSIDDTKTQLDQIEKQLKDMESQLAKVDSDAKEGAGRNDDQGRAKLDADTKRNDGVAKQHVFISYCHDNLSEITQLQKDLTDVGERVWWDQNILPGLDWEQAIEQAIEQCYAFVACLSKETEARFETGIYPELDKAIQIFRNYAPGKVFIIPVRLSECQLPRIKISATSQLNKLQYVDLFPPSQRDAGLQKLIKAIKAAPEHP